MAKWRKSHENTFAMLRDQMKWRREQEESTARIHELIASTPLPQTPGASATNLFGMNHDTTVTLEKSWMSKMPL